MTICRLGSGVTFSGNPARGTFNIKEDPKHIQQEEHDKELISELGDDIPFYGYRKIALEAGDRFGVSLSFKRIQRLRREMGVHVVIPYLFHGKEIVRENQVRHVDITYIPVAVRHTLSVCYYRCVSAGRCCHGIWRILWMGCRFSSL